MEHSTFILENDLVKLQLEFQKEARIHRERPEVKALMNELKSITSFVDFRSYMHKILCNRFPSPLYSFSSEDDNSDNHWWKNGEPIYELLKEMNKHFVTVFAQEDGGITTDTIEVENALYRTVMFECPLLSFLFPKSEVEDLILRLKQYPYYRYAISNESAKKIETIRIPLRWKYYYDDKNTRVKTEKDTISFKTNLENTHFYSVNEVFLNNQEGFLSDELYQVLISDYVVCDVMDMNFTSPEKEDGLFTTLLKIFESMNL
jgi:hypothetical protein